MTDWSAAIQDQINEISKRTPARAPATLGEIWDTEWKGAGLDTALGVHKPFQEAYSELADRIQSVTGKKLGELLPPGTEDFDLRGMAGQIDALGQIVDRLPDPQQKMLEGYKDVWARAKVKASEIEKQSEDVSGATYGLTGNSVAFLAGIARQSVDPVNLAMMPIGGPAKGPVVKWLGKEFLIGAGTQAVQEPYIAARRDELGLQSDSMMNVFEAGVGQAGFSGLMRAAGKVYHLWRGEAGVPRPDLMPADFDAAARQYERDATFERMAGGPAGGTDKLNRAERILNNGEPLAGLGPARSTAMELDGVQPIIRPDGSRLEARYAVVERSQLITSHGADGIENPAFPKELQPRDRSQATSLVQVNDIAAKLQPERLGPSPIAQEGAPIVGSDGIVESGNGRVLALETAYARFPDRAEAYRAYLESLGFDAARGMKEPVLVRIRQQDLSFAERAAFASESNVATTGALSASERAFMDAKGLHEGIMELWQGGQASDAKNAPFVRRFAAELLAPQEQKAFVDNDGRLAAQGQDRIEAAVVARAYGDQAIVRDLTESTDQRAKSILGAFADAAPMVARLRSAVADGRVAEDLDIAKALVDAFHMVDRARRTGAKLADMLDQIDLERGAVPPGTKAAVELFYRNDALTLPASRETVAERINKAAEQAIMHQAGGFFGDELDAAGALRAARFATENLSNMDLAKRMSEAAQAEPAVKPIEPKKLEEVPTPPSHSFPDERILDQSWKQPGNDRILTNEERDFLQTGNDVVVHIPTGRLVLIKEDGARWKFKKGAQSPAETSTYNPQKGGMGTHEWRPADGVEASFIEDVHAGISHVNAWEMNSSKLDMAGTNRAAPIEITPESVRSWDELKNAQPFTTTDELYQRAPQAQATLISALREINLGQLKDPGLKKQETAEAKIARKAYDSARELTDIVRAGVVFDNPADVEPLIRQLKERFEIRDEGWNTTEVGYTDRKVMVIMPDGMIAEVQLWERSFLDAKKGGHKIYERRREAQAAGDFALADQIKAEEIAYWRPYQEALPPAWREEISGAPNAASGSANAATALPSGSDRPSSSTSAGSTERQPLPVNTRADVPSGETTANRLSQSKNLDFAGNMGETSSSKIARAETEINARVNSVLSSVNEGQKFSFEMPDGTVVQANAREYLAKLSDERKAAAELHDCIDRTGGRIEVTA